MCAELIIGSILLGIRGFRVSVTRLHLAVREKALKCYFTERGLVCRAQTTGYRCDIGIMAASLRHHVSTGIILNYLTKVSKYSKTSLVMIFNVITRY